jgi:threonine-phosphate decarboxylase
MDEIVHYPDPYASRLVSALAAEWNVEPDCILAGNGATDLIHFFARTLRAEDVSLVVPTFTEFHRAWPDAALVHMDDRWPGDGLLVLTNPNNPTGLRMRVRERRGLTLIDESFIEFTGWPSAIGAGCLVLRSLTKFQAIPGLRAGAMVGPPDLMRRLRAQREPWQVNVLAEAAALASRTDIGHAQQTREYVGRESARVAAAVSKIEGVSVTPPAANYVFARLDYPADSLAQHLIERRILIRVCSAMPGIQGEAVRFAIRRREDNDRLLKAWREFR